MATERHTRATVPTTAGNNPSNTGLRSSRASRGDTSPKINSRSRLPSPLKARYPTRPATVQRRKMALAQV